MADYAYQEWRNHNSQRNYPFADDISLMSEEGIALRNDVFIDGFFYPIDIHAPLYLSKIDIANQRILVSAGGKVVADATIVPGNVLDFYDTHGRQIGMLIKTDEFKFIGSDMTFKENTGQFAAACVMPQNQPGVRGFMMPGGDIITGEVTFEGIDGVNIDSYINGDGKHILRISAVGEQEPPGCVDLPDPLTCIIINNGGQGSLILSQSGSEILIGHRAELYDVCDNKDKLPNEDGDLPNPGGDPCVEEEEEDCDPNPPPPTGECPDEPGFFYISAAGTLLRATPYIGEELAGAALLDYIYNPVLPPRQAQGLIISLRGQEVN